MFYHTNLVFEKIKDDFKKYGFYFNLSTQAIYIIYLLYRLIVQSKLWVVNLILLALSIAYLVFFVRATKKEEKTVRKKVKRVYKWSKKILNLFPLGLSVYSLWQTVAYTSPLSIIISAFMLASGVLSILFFIIHSILKNLVGLFVEALKEDFWVLSKDSRANKVENFFKKLRGEEIEPTQSGALKKLVDEDKNAKEAQKEEQLLLKQEQRLAKKQERKNIVKRIPALFKKKAKEESAYTLSEEHDEQTTIE